jgi:signal transduction histidine kinase
VRRTSLSTRIFVGFAVVVATSGLATFYANAAVSALRHELSFLRDRALPLLEELRRSSAALRGYDEALQRAAPQDLEWVVRLVPEAKPYARVDQILAHTRTLQEFSQPPRLAVLVTGARMPLPVLGESLAKLHAAHESRDRLAGDAELLAAAPGLGKARTDAEAFEALVLGLEGAMADKRQAEAGLLVVEIRRLIRNVHGALGKAEASFERALNTRFDEADRAELRLQVLVVGASVASFIVALVVLLLTVATLRPMTQLTEVVRRFAGGERSARAQEQGASEVATLALEWNRMADALALREAQLSAQREDLARGERLQALGQMAARMAHEVRNPLSSIGLNAELLADEVQSSEARELLGAIVQEVERLRGVTDGYLERARPAPAEHRPVALHELAASLVDFVRGELQLRGVQVTLQLQPASVSGDPALLRQALWNLVRNGWEALPEGGQLWVEVRAGEGRAKLVVEDSGVGVPEAMRETIFQPFTTSKPAGTGIGLALVRETARAHQGDVRLLAGEHGSGARFELDLPLLPT